MSTLRRYWNTGAPVLIRAGAAALGRAAVPMALGAAGRFIKRGFGSEQAAIPYVKRRRTPGSGSRMRTGGFLSAQARQAKAELNFLDVVLNTTHVDSTASFTLLNGMLPGSDANTRLGRKIHIKSVQIKGNVSATAVAPATGGAIIRCKTALVYDKQANASTANFNNVWDNSTAVTNPNVTTMRNISNADRFVILWDDTADIDIDYSGTAVNHSANSVHALDYYRKCNLETQYNTSATGDISGIATGAFFLVTWMNDQPNRTLSGIGNWDLTVRIRFDPA